MKADITHLDLGATMYCPSTNLNAYTLVTGQKYPELKSLVLCLEDAILESEVEVGLQNIENIIQKFNADETSDSYTKPLVFIRPRSDEMGLQIAAKLREIDSKKLITGFVIPKFTIESISVWEMICKDFYIMPTLETVEIFDVNYIQRLRDSIKENLKNVIACRIGGNDLMSCIGLRRPKDVSIYSTPLNSVIDQIINTFIPHGISLSSPVFENFENKGLLLLEIESDMARGLFAKTAIHPSQISLIQDSYKVRKQDLNEANQILCKDAKAVFKSNGSMLEPATHRKWAENIIKRHEIYGCRDDD